MQIMVLGGVVTLPTYATCARYKLSQGHLRAFCWALLARVYFALVQLI